MSKDIIVLTPNGRRQKIQCTPDTSILQVLEDACQKQGFQPSDYDLKYHNHVLDLTTTIRFSNVPNKATLEMVEAERKREEFNVTIGLLLEDGERRTADFPPYTSLYDLVTSLAPTELNLLQHPSILYMRQEVTGVTSLREKTLRQLGLIKGRAILRLLNKAEEARQANVSAVYRRSVTDSGATKVANTDEEKPTKTTDEMLPGPSVSRKIIEKTIDPIKLIKNEKLSPKEEERQINAETQDTKDECVKNNATIKKDQIMDVESKQSDIARSTSSNASISQEKLERRLNIEEEVTFLGTQKAIAFMQSDEMEDELEDLPDEFYELTIEEVRRLYTDLQQHRLQLENTPLVTAAKREEFEKQTSSQSLNTYRNVVVRIQFPDRIILQGVFTPANTIEDVNTFIKEHLESPDKPFHIYATPLKETLDPKMTLLEAKFVPCVHIHFKWLEEDAKQAYLKEEIYSKITTSDAASILASKYRAPSRRKIDDNTQTSSAPTASTSRNSKVPKWFKN